MLRVWCNKRKVALSDGRRVDFRGHTCCKVGRLLQCSGYPVTPYIITHISNKVYVYINYRSQNGFISSQHSASRLVPVPGRFRVSSLASLRQTQVPRTETYHHK